METIHDDHLPWGRLVAYNSIATGSQCGVHWILCKDKDQLRYKFCRREKSPFYPSIHMVSGYFWCSCVTVWYQSLGKVEISKCSVHQYSKFCYQHIAVLFILLSECLKFQTIHVNYTDLKIIWHSNTIHALSSNQGAYFYPHLHFATQEMNRNFH